uniref:Uncharacterized protein n=1 Tax=Utricularia reniformis TaxID=192314 RepID=A0A1Y0B462_9LAMI|nr:hypothetical protein AEK19_MT2092 [Utricularia reniformis]ART32246.1 hypothetical protein AEK19_MT2092 [Utricularia reniformis]
MGSMAPCHSAKKIWRPYRGIKDLHILNISLLRKETKKMTAYGLAPSTVKEAPSIVTSRNIEEAVHGDEFSASQRD